MKVKSFLFGFTFILSAFLIIPQLLVYFNKWFSLPVFTNETFKVFGVFFIIVGIFTIGCCWRVFKFIGKGTPVPLEPPKQLVATGLYKYTRNPIYIAYFLILLGEFFIFGSLLIFLYFLMSLPMIHLYVLQIEEPKLKKRFGEKYNKYLETVPRWFPYILPPRFRNISGFDKTLSSPI